MSSTTEKKDTRPKPAQLPRISAPPLPYRPRDPKRYRPGIGLIGCGGISKWHLTAYRAAGYRVLALCDIALDRARQRRDEFYPEATATDNAEELLRRDDIEVVDITTHPPDRPPLVEAALRARKHVLQGTVFETVRHLILYDFAIHWFDFVRTVMDEAVPRRIFASMARSSTQTIMPALLAQTMIEYESTQVTLIFDGFTRYDHLDRTLVVGSAGAIRSTGPSTHFQRVEMTTAEGLARPRLKGSWFPDGFHGAMAELLSAIAEKREPSNSARNNLTSLALCFAAVASAERGEAVRPGSVRQLPAEEE